MMNGVDIIAKEREEQINKHKWNDDIHKNGELIEAALFALDPMKFDWPVGWSYDSMLKIKEKAYVNRLAVAGALIAAEYDRIMKRLLEGPDENLPK
jgi:hypothetical protein